MQVDKWLKCAWRFYPIPPVNLSELIPEVRAWWAALQPAEWVGPDGEILERNISEDTNWSVLARSSKNGFFMFMIVLSWWANAATTPALSVEFHNFVEDVNWVLGMLLVSQLSGKRRRMDDDDEVDDDDEQPPKKR